jgi:hypothetical protein
MFDMNSIGKVLIFIGLGIAALGVLMWAVGRAPFWGRLPGDLVFQHERISCFFPLATSIILSIVLTMVLNVIVRWLNR